MSRYITVLGFCFLCLGSFAQFVARMEIKEHIDGLCDEKNVYAFLPMLKGQSEAVCPVSNATIRNRLENEVVFLKDSANYEGKGMVNIIINCKGDVVKCETDNKTKSPILDQQIVAVFNSLGKWKPGKLNGEKVDSSKLWSFKIEKGKIIID
jgi:hypothetical protein